MPSAPTPSLPAREWAYHVLILAVGLTLTIVMGADVARHGADRWFATALLVGVPLIAVIARFPMVLDSGSGAIEVGFESCVLMFLLCVLDTAPALVVWCLGVLLTQALAETRASARTFNIGIGMIGGGLAAAAYGIVNPGDSIETLRGLLAVTAAAVSYFLTDYVLSAVSLTISSRSPLRATLFQPETALAIACFVPLDSLGYLAAVVALNAPWWTLSLLGIPLLTLLIATRAITRGRENARRLGVLFGAAGRAQTLVDRQALIEALCADAGELLRLRDVKLRAEPPAEGEIGVEVSLGDDDMWLVARAAQRARATIAGDRQALEALAAVAADASARIELVDEKLHVARHDPLTDLPNRGILLDRTNQALARAHASHGRPALIFLDLDGFKPVNDRFGHQAGDLVLVDVAARLRACVRDQDTVARLGGDEFAVLVEDADPADVAAMCDRILRRVAAGTVVSGQEVRLGASIGISYDRGNDSAGSLLRNADLAMYQAKSEGKGRYTVFEPAMGHARVERLELLEDLRAAVDADQIGVAYQPVVDPVTRRIVGMETLARWQRAGVSVPPDTFISIAEESGLIVALGAAVLRRVELDAAAIRASGGLGRAVSVNVSAAQLREPGFVDMVLHTARELEGMTLVLEITERQGVDLTGGVLEAMHTIADRGVGFAIDDFGVGFSSISYLQNLPATVIKADAALSRNIDRDSRARSLLRSVTEMGRTLGFRVVVEGVERESQLDVIRQDAPYASVQGYLLHRPMPLEQLLRTLAGDLDAAEQPAG
ncbi:MAG: putative bifunctional diguanylate cyclase/phosphodiesterase [Nocardioides sp.]